MRILLVAARFPDPLLSGCQVRAYPQLRLPSRRHKISLVCFTAQRPDLAARQTVTGFEATRLRRKAIGDFPRRSVNPNGFDLERFPLGTAARCRHGR